MLCNAIYFKGEWAAKFDAKATEQAPFDVGAGKSVSVPMMNRRGSVRVAHLDEVALLELPYKGEALSMVILLPEATNGLAGLEAKLDAARVQQWLAALDQARPRPVRVALPRFKTTASYNLSKTLYAMGMAEAFGTSADFSGMTGKPDLRISDVVHKAFVEVNEEGTEAAAATGVEMSLRSARPEEFRLDRPFVFVVRDNQTGSLLFLGRITDPTK